MTDAGAAADAPGAFEQRREVGVHVAGVAAAAGYLVAGGGHLAQRLAVVGHVDEDDEDVQAEFEGEVLGGGQGGAGADEPLRRGFVGAVEEDDRAFEGGSLGEARADVGRLPLGHADRGEDDDEASSEPGTRAAWAIRVASSRPGRP